VLRLRNVTKTFPGLRALDDLSLELQAGEILAVVGQNGSGKSTLVKTLAGVYTPDPGSSIEVVGPSGEPLRGHAARETLRFIHQDLGLVGMLDTVENLDLAHEVGGRGVLPTRRRLEERHARELIARFGTSFDVRLPVARLTPSQRTIVAIARALDGWQDAHKLLVLDEPTAALPAGEVTQLFEAVRRVADSGAGVMFISHRLDEVFQLADRIVVLRDGRLVADVAAGDLDHEALVTLIAGRALERVDLDRPGGPGAPVLSARALSGATVEGIDFDVAAGEIVGIGGLLGSGREHVAGLLFGAVAASGGDVRVGGRPLSLGDPRAAIAGGIGFVPADRAAQGAVMDMSVRENLTLPHLAPLRTAVGALDGKAERDEARAWAGRLDLRPPEPDRPLKLFSGGNQQKVVMAKWLRTKSQVLLFDEPTQGVDVQAKASIYQLVAAAAREGVGVLVSSSDMKELAALCDRVLVLRDGRIAAELRGSALSEAQLIRESFGLEAEQVDALFGDVEGSTHA
jgi:ribose transport system ATP-binding protein